MRTLDLAPLDDAGLEAARRGVARRRARPPTAARLVEGADVLVHAAAALPIQASRESIRSVNVGGTATLLAAAPEAGVRRHVLVSSTAVYGIPKAHPIYEDSPLVGVGHYGESKIEAEEVTRDFGRRGLEFAIVRPKTFVGPERLGVFEILFDWIREGRRIYVLGSGHNRYQLLAVEDLVDAIVLAAERPEAAGETVNVGAKRVRHRARGSRRADRARRVGIAADVVPGEARRDRAAGARAAPRVAARRMALQDGAPGLVRRRRQGRAAARLGAAVLERRGAQPDLRLVPGEPGDAQARRA